MILADLLASLPSDDDLRVEQARRWGLAEFVREGWHVLEPNTPLEWNWHLDAICDHVQAVLEGWLAYKRTGQLPVVSNLLINVPPGCLKSRIVNVYAVAWMWIRWPTWSVLCTSAAEKNVNRDALLTRDLVTSEWYRETFRLNLTLAPDQRQKLNFRNSAGGWRTCATTGGRITGVKGDAIFVDDPNDAQEVVSDVKRDSINHWWATAAYNRVNDPRVAVRICIMQRLHEDDFTGHVLKAQNDDAEPSNEDWEQLVIPQEYDPRLVRTTWIGWNDPRTVAGELMFAARFTPAFLAKARQTLGAAGYAGQHGQDPLPPGGVIFRREFWKRCSVLPKLDYWFSVWDLGNSENPTAQASFSAGGAFGVAGPNRYVMDVKRAQLSPLQSEYLIRDAHAEWTQRWGPPRVRRVENKAAGAAVTERLRIVEPGMLPANPKGDKIQRALAVAPEVEVGNWWLLDGPWVAAWIDELQAFPLGAHDDQVDLISDAGVYLRSRAVQIAKIDRAVLERGVRPSRWKPGAAR